jgi:hypothetical protein
MKARLSSDPGVPCLDSGGRRHCSRPKTTEKNREVRAFSPEDGTGAWEGAMKHGKEDGGGAIPGRVRSARSDETWEGSG